MTRIEIKRLTKSELRESFRVYREAFPDWSVEHDVVLVRSNGPISQRIAFEALMSGDYRPSCSIRVLAPPDGSQLLFKHLDVKHREISRRQHPTKWPLVLKAMEEQFLPPIREPLDVAETTRLAEEAVERDRINNINHFAGLATLHAYLGNDQRALYWCDHVEHRVRFRDRDLADWEVRKVEYLWELRRAIETGNGRAFVIYRSGE